MPKRLCLKRQGGRAISRWSIQTKLLLCVALLCLIVATLAVSGFRGVYSYRQLARTISLRASELPVAGGSWMT